MSLLWVATLLAAICVTIIVVRVAIFARLCPRLALADEIANAPLISVIVPARNEAANIERCVRSLLAQTYPNLEIVVIDDGSDDATPAILARLAAESSRLRVLVGRPLPRGWLGKPYAVYQAVQRARGDWLLFVDADVTLHPSVLSSAYQAAQHNQAALISLWARQELGTLWERIVQPVIIGLNHSVDPFQRSSSPRHPDAVCANGQFMLVERQAYERVGGHIAVRDELVEDQKLSWHFKRAGYRALMLDGTWGVSTRMYTSLRGIWEGWSKSNFLMLGRSYLLVLAGILTTFIVIVSPTMLFVCSLLMQVSGSQAGYLLLINLLLILALLVTRWRMRRYFPTPLTDYLWHPIGGLIFIGIIFNSAYRHSCQRGVVWKGRRYRDVDSVA
ncbi:MAG TPA: glycosyltransferase family 2 protein [Roseiflexaceae bacterium]|nr:glycosyltransferase family 2 protein [Roseiflexaceae bacterium]